MSQIFSTSILTIDQRAPIEAGSQRMIWSARYSRWHLLTEWPPAKLISEMGYTHWFVCPGPPSN